MTQAVTGYAKTHEWVRLEDSPWGRVAVVGISAFAIEALTDLVYVGLPSVGRQVEPGEACGEIESVKAVSDIYSPVAGEIVEVNNTLVGPSADLEQMKQDPLGAGWLFKVRLSSDAGLEALIGADAYAAQCAAEGH